MFAAYLDESYGEEIMAVGGWVATAKSWRRLQVSWQGFLARERIEVVGCSDLVHGDRKRPYNTWDQPRRERLFSDCVETIHRNVAIGVVVSVSRTELRQVLQRHDLNVACLNELAYQICGLGCIAAALSYVGNSPLTVVFESGMRGSETLQRAAQLISERRQDRGVRLTLPLPSKRVVVALQAADFMAWAHHSYARRVEQTRDQTADPPDVSEQIIGNMEIRGGYYPRRSLAYLLSCLPPGGTRPDIAKAWAALESMPTRADARGRRTVR